MLGLEEEPCFLMLPTRPPGQQLPTAEGLPYASCISTWKLPRVSALPGGLGAYLCLTGAALGGAELKELGLATHYTEAQVQRNPRGWGWG